MDHPFYWDNALLSPVDTQTLPDYVFSPSDIDIDYQNEAPQGSERSSIWTSFDTNAVEFQGNQVGDVSRMEDGWNPTLSINSGDNPNMEDQHFQRSRALPLENMDINLNTVADERSLLHEASNASQSSSQSADAKNVDTHGKFIEKEMLHYLPELYEPEHVPSSISDGRSSSAVGLVFESSSEGLDHAMEGQRVDCKRKNFERAIGESSATIDTHFFHQNGRNYRNPTSLCHNTAEKSNASSSSKLFSAANSLDKQPNPCLRAIKGVTSECDPSFSTTGNADTSKRNFRVRLNPEEQHYISHCNSIPIACNSNLSGIGSLSEPSYNLSPLNHTLAESQHCVPPIPYMPRQVSPPMNQASSSRGGSSSSSGKSKKSLIDSFEEENMRNLPRSSIPDYPTFLIGTNSSHLRQGPSNGSPYNSSMTINGNLAVSSRASSSSGINSLPGLINIRHEVASIQHPRGQSPSSQELGEPSGIAPPGRPHYIRPALLLDRQSDGMPSIPLSIRNREGRDRMISEIRNALDLMRRGENFRFEDAFVRDHSAFFGRVDLHDRHRDMRLDVDNMTYEELLALEDKIGYVSSGLSEDTILKNLNQHKHSLRKLEEESPEQEPCCICREEYCEGEDLAELGCSHDFHTSCIKQWLMIKNLCPICKTTALVI